MLRDFFNSPFFLFYLNLRKVKNEASILKRILYNRNCKITKNQPVTAGLFWEVFMVELILSVNDKKRLDAGFAAAFGGLFHIMSRIFSMRWRCSVPVEMI